MESKPYVVIARKYRPQNFDEVVGQDAISTTLKNAIALGRIGHAYLFSGPRGVGKTSMARIFAKALNCTSGPTANPCGKCQACVDIETSRALDVLEIDGASNRGIDEIRALRENVRFAAAAGKFKIYIIDEVHQITSDGFNALLKTLEEPPAHVKFIFATTVPQKVPATILSRCQRFDFRRISAEQIASTLRRICKEEKIKIEDDALFVIAKSADGSLRDSQSMLDQIASHSRDKISKADVVQSLGALEEETVVELTALLARGDAPGSLRILDRVLNEGKDPVHLMEKILEHVRNLLFVSVSEKLADSVDATESYRTSLLDQAKTLSREDLFYFFSVITHTLQTMKRFEMRRIPLEVACIKLAHRVPMHELSELLQKLGNAEKKTAFAEPLVEERTIQEPKSSSLKENPETPDVEELPANDLSLEAVYRKSLSVTLDSIWEGLLRGLREEKISVASYLAEGEPLDMKDGVATIRFHERLSFHRESLEMSDNKRLVEKHLSRLLDQEVRVRFESVKGPDEEKNASVSGASGGATPAASNPMIESAVKLFGGRIVEGS